MAPAEKTSPSSINKHTPSSWCCIDSQSSVFTHLFSPSVALSSLLRRSQTFIATITVSCHYPFEWEGATVHGLVFSPNFKVKES